MRIFLRAMMVIALAAGSLATPAAAFEDDTDRPGLDYTNFELRGGPRACEQECRNDSRCAAWTYVRSGIQGPSARCWLKHEVPGAVPSTCCVSGVVR